LAHDDFLSGLSMFVSCMVVFRGASVIKLVWSFRSCWLTCYSCYACLYNIINKCVFRLVELLSLSIVLQAVAKLDADFKSSTLSSINKYTNFVVCSCFGSYWKCVHASSNWTAQTGATASSLWLWYVLRW